MGKTCDVTGWNKCDATDLGEGFPPLLLARAKPRQSALKFISCYSRGTNVSLKRVPLRGL